MNANQKHSQHEWTKTHNQLDKLDYENLSDLVDINLNPKKLFFNTKEAARLLRITTRTLLNWRNEGIIGFVQVKHVILYKWEHIQDFVKSNELNIQKK